MDPMSGFDILLVFELPPRLQYKRCAHLWNNFPCIITLLSNIFFCAGGSLLTVQYAKRVKMKIVCLSVLHYSFLFKSLKSYGPTFQGSLSPNKEWAPPTLQPRLILVILCSCVRPCTWESRRLVLLGSGYQCKLNMFLFIL